MATVLIFAWLVFRIETDNSGTTQLMPEMSEWENWTYWLCQAFGWSALLWMYITVLLGLMRAGPQTNVTWLRASRVEKWHRTTSLTTIGLTFMHALMFLVDKIRANREDYSGIDRVLTTFVHIWVPGTYPSGIGRVAIFIGLLAFYLAIPLALAFYLRHSTGSRMWVALHRFIIVVYVLSVWHTLLYGTNVWYGGAFRSFVWALQIPLAVLLLARLFAPARPRERLRLDRSGRRENHATWVVRLLGRSVVALVVLGLLAVLLTGVDGGRPQEGHGSHDLWPERWVIWVGLALLVVVLATVVVRLRRPPPRRNLREGGSASGAGHPGVRAEPDALDPADTKEAGDRDTSA